MFQVAEVAVGALGQVEDHEVRVVDGPIVGAGGDVSNAAGLVGRHADDAVVLLGDAEMLGLAGLGGRR